MSGEPARKKGRHGGSRMNSGRKYKKIYQGVSNTLKNDQQTLNFSRTSRTSTSSPKFIPNLKDHRLKLIENQPRTILTYNLRNFTKATANNTRQQSNVSACWVVNRNITVNVNGFLNITTSDSGETHLS